MQDHYTTEQLNERGWTSSMIKFHLVQPDEECADPNGPVKKSVELYRTERVHAAETGAARSDLEKLLEEIALAKRALQLKNRAVQR